MANNANYQRSSFGPNFGGDNDIHIKSNAISMEESYTGCGNTYRYDTLQVTCPCDHFMGSYQFTLDDVGVLHVL